MPRLFVFVFVFLVTATPILPAITAAFHADHLITKEQVRVWALACNTALLILGASMVAVPAGTMMAIALSRLLIPFRETARLCLFIGLFIPLPIYVSAWQIVLGSWLPAPLGPGSVEWRPWRQGLLPAAFVHGVASLPWVIWIVSNSLRHSDTGVEEDAIMTGGFTMWLRLAILPRAMLGAAAGLGWTAVQCVTEIAVTDVMMVRTFAEEVYTEFVAPSNGFEAAAATAVPAWFAFTLLGGGLARGVSLNFAAPAEEIGRPPVITTNRPLPVGFVFWLITALFVLLPLSALVWKAGMGGRSSGFSPVALLKNLKDASQVDGGLLLGSVGAAFAAGLVAASLALIACCAARDSRLYSRILFVWSVICAVAPGPVVGFGMKRAIAALLDCEDWLARLMGLSPEFPPLRSMLYNQPSPIPAIWVTTVRFFPLACAVLWPVIRAIPTVLLEEIRLDGLGPYAAMRRVIFPLTGPAFLSAAAAVAAIALGEVGASKLVNPSGRTTFILRIFDLMHYGADSTVAAYALLQIGLTIVGALLFRKLLAGQTGGLS